ncbi:MAG: hypothetical protein RIT45_2963 [Pseudomonadota bacterium]
MVRPMRRRDWLRIAGGSALLAVACGRSGGTDVADETETAAVGDDAAEVQADVQASDAAETGGGIPASWAAGGTAAMTAKASYPDPFVALGPGCALLCATTDGPCTTPTSPLRVDVSEGQPGLPVRLLLRLQDVDCAPVAGAEVWIWHTDVRGVYSGPTPDPPRCYGADPAAPEAMYFRGRQETDADGRVAFDTCFPGFYPSRAVHIHVQIRLADAATHTGQVFFDDALISEIFGSHPDYAPFGLPKTRIPTDGVLAGEPDLAPLLLQHQRMSDGAMLAWKTLTVRSSLLAQDPRICGA